MSALVFTAGMIAGGGVWAALQGARGVGADAGDGCTRVDCACGSRHEIAGEVPLESFERIGWRRVAGQHLCPLCAGTMAQLRRYLRCR